MVDTSKRHYDAGQSSEWYTPAEYLQAARATMGAIDLDPASCAMANEVVQASAYFDRSTDGLSRQWIGRVWLNAPYSDYKGQAAQWAAHLLREYRAGRVTQAIMLCNLSIAYQEPVQQIALCGAVCMVAKRIRFYDQSGEAQRLPTQANAIYYLGDHLPAFAEHFGRFGVTLKGVMQW